MKQKKESVHNKYNLYHLRKGKYDDLLKKFSSVGLHEQKSKIHKDYQFMFYYSDELDGNDIWWYKTYKDFFLDDITEPENIFHFAVMVINKVSDIDNWYLISLGKSHFYLNKFIERDFGISVAMKIADEESMLLKKSRIFGGGKRQEITSYIEFVKDNYEAGESVEHLKLKAVETEIWGENSIIFADSIQFDLERSPLDLIPVIEQIEIKLKEESILQLPKLEIEKDEEIIEKLDNCLKDLILSSGQEIKLEEFTTYGVDFCFNYLNYDYELYYRDKSTQKNMELRKLGSVISINDLKDIFGKLDSGFIFENIKVRFLIDGKGKFTKCIKEILDCHIDDSEGCYFLRDGAWFRFNSRFMDFLKSSIESITMEIEDDFDESEYVKWMEEKRDKISKDIPVNDKITYREYFFNLMKSVNDGYVLMDREQTLINSLRSGKRKYILEVADLYKDKTIFSVKMGKKKESLIYNIQQSINSIELINKKVIKTDKIIEKCGLWFVLDEDIKTILDINSIQFLLAIESWKRKVIACSLTPVIKVSKRINIDK